MRKVAFALAHCFQTCLISLACCSTCLVICLLTEIALKKNSVQIGLNSLLITLKLLAVCKLVCTFARNLLVSRAKSLVSRAKSFRSVWFCQNFVRSVKLLRAKLNNWCRVSRELWNFLARAVKLSRATCKTVSRGLKLLHVACKGFSREILCQHFHFLVCFSYLRPEHSLFEFVIVPCPWTVLNNDTLIHRKHDSCTLTKSHLINYLFVFAS